MLAGGQVISTEAHSRARHCGGISVILGVLTGQDGLQWCAPPNTTSSHMRARRSHHLTCWLTYKTCWVFILGLPCMYSFLCLPTVCPCHLHPFAPGCMGNVHWDCVARLLVPAQVLRPGHVTSGQRSVLKLTLFLWTAASARDGMCAAGQPDMSVQSPLYSPQLPPHTTLLAHSCCVFLPAVKAPAGAVTGLCE